MKIERDIRFCGEALRASREARRMTLADLAHAITELGIPATRQTVGQWERGKADPGGNYVMALVELFGGPEPTRRQPDGYSCLAQHGLFLLVDRPDGSYIIGPQGANRGPLTAKERAACLADEAMMERIL